MARTNDTYQPSEEMVLLLRRYMSGDRGEDVMTGIREEQIRNPRFTIFFNRLKSQTGKMSGRNSSTWSIGTNGSRVSGSNPGMGGFSQGVSRWNQHRNERAGYSGFASSPGGFKSSGRDEDSALRRSGTMTSDAIRSKVNVDFGKGTATFGGRTYSKAQLNGLLARGMSGATMNWKDQAIYDSLIGYGSNMDEAKAARLEEMRKSSADPDEIERKNAEQAARLDAEDLLKRRRDLADWKAKEDYKKQLEDKSGQWEGLNAKHGLPFGTRLSQKDYDALESGEKVYDYDPDVSAKYDRDAKDLNDKYVKNEIDQKTYDSMIAKLDETRARSGRRLVKNSSPKTVDQLIAGSKDGLYVNKNGELSAIPDTFSNKRAQKLEDAKVARQNRLDDIAENRAQERRKWVATQVVNRRGAYDKARAKAEKDFAENDNDGKDFVYPDFDEASEIKRLYGIYDATEGSPASDNQMTPEMLGEARMLKTESDAELGTDNANAPAVQPTQEPTTRFNGYWRPNAEAFSNGICPVCNAELDGWGNCPVCGYPDENLVAEWKAINEGGV